MGIIRALVIMAFSIAGFWSAQAEDSQRRLALVIGQGAYVAGALPHAVNDAGLVAQTLIDSGFEVVEGRDLDTDGLRRLVRDFLDRAEKAGPDADLAVYVSGYAAQLEGDNYLLPVDAKLARASDVALSGFRLSDLVRSMNVISAHGRIIIIDAPYEFPGMHDKTMASGLALVEPPPGFLIAYASAPGVVIPTEAPKSTKNEDVYNIYAKALVEQMRQSGLDADEMFKRVRLQVHEETKGVQVPWHASALKEPFQFFNIEGATPHVERALISKSAEEAYALAIESDTIAGYQDFLRNYPDHALAKRIQVLLANRREAVVWNRAVGKNTAEAYWSYLKSYSRGPHVEDARRRLALLSRPASPPDQFDVVIYDDVPPPLPVEIIYQETYIYNDYREYYSYPPPPMVPVVILPVRAPIAWRPPVAPSKPGFLPVPQPLPLPPHVRPIKRPPHRFAPVAPVVVPGHPPAEAARPPERRPDVLPRPGQTLPLPQWKPEGAQENSVPRRPGQVAPSQPVQVQPSPSRPTLRPEVSRPDRPIQNPARPADRPIEKVSPPVERPRPVERPVVPTERVRPVERPAAAPVERIRPAQRPAVPVERARPIQRPVPVERARPMERPVVPIERIRPAERPAVAPIERARPVQRPSPVERAAPPVERPRPIERAAPPVERPTPAPQMQRAPVQAPQVRPSQPQPSRGGPGRPCILPTGQPCP